MNSIKSNTSPLNVDIRFSQLTQHHFHHILIFTFNFTILPFFKIFAAQNIENMSGKASHELLPQPMSHPRLTLKTTGAETLGKGVEGFRAL